MFAWAFWKIKVTVKTNTKKDKFARMTYKGNAAWYCRLTALLTWSLRDSWLTFSEINVFLANFFWLSGAAQAIFAGYNYKKVKEKLHYQTYFDIYDYLQNLAYCIGILPMEYPLWSVRAKFVFTQTIIYIWMAYIQKESSLAATVN